MPFAVICSSVARTGRKRDGQRDRAVAVAGPEESASLSRELDAHPERPAVLTWVLAPEDAAADRWFPFYGLRHLVRPALTGWAQVKYPYGASEDDAPREAAGNVGAPADLLVQPLLRMLLRILG